MITLIDIKNLPTLRAQIFWSLIPIILFFFLLLGVIVLFQQKRLVDEEFMKRGHVLARSLARSSELGVFAEDRELLAISVRGLVADPDVAYAVVYGEGGRMLTMTAVPHVSLHDRQWKLSHAETELVYRIRKNTSHEVAGDAGRFIEFLAPVVSQGPTLPDELQIGILNRESGVQRSEIPRAIGAVRLGLSPKAVDAHFASLLKWQGGLIALFLGVVTLVIYGFARRITRPIRGLTDSARNIADGFLDHVIPSGSRDEIGQLARSFNDMTTALKSRTREKEQVLAQLRDLNLTLEHRIQQRTAEIESVNAQLLEANRHKSAFLANVNHELRTPVSAIIGFTRLLLRKTEGQIGETEKEKLQKTMTTAEHLLDVINGLLDLSKIESGQMELFIEPFKVEEVVQSACSTVEPTMNGHVRLVRDVAPDLPALNTDRNKLEQILINLLSNSVKFTERGEVKISAARENGSLKLVVSDTGIGIEKAALNHIFEEFRQGDKSSARKFGGTGLGLAIVRKLVSVLGGEITVESELDKGSAFTVTLPLNLDETEHGDADGRTPDEP